MNEKAGIQISQKLFIQSIIILLILMVLAGILGIVVPSGSFERVIVDGQQEIIPGTYATVEKPDYPFWRWLTAPVEVLWGPDALVIIVIILFILMIGAAFAVLDKSGFLAAGLSALVDRIGNRKYTLLLVISFFFMLLGAFFGILEEIVPLVPVIIVLSYSLGWDALVGISISVLATNLGFSAAITNPFTIGVAQELAGLPLFSGWMLRIPIFLAIYLAFAFFITRYARKIEKDPTASAVYGDPSVDSSLSGLSSRHEDTPKLPHIKAASIWFGAFIVLILAVLLSFPYIEAVSDYALPVVGLLFLIAGIGTGLISGAKGRTVWSGALEGLVGIAPSIILILMASSVKMIVVESGIMDTFLNSASNAFSETSPFFAAVLIYLLALVIEVFVASGSAKAFLLMPILLPLGDLIGVSRQTSVLAYCFGDGFSNMVYPTNPILLIVLGLSGVSFLKWVKWSWKFWAVIILISLAFLGVAVGINYQ